MHETGHISTGAWPLRVYDDSLQEISRLRYVVLQALLTVMRLCHKKNVVAKLLGKLRNR